MSVEWWVLTTEQLRAKGRSEYEVRCDVRAGALKRLHRGVYLAGPRLGGDLGWLQDVCALAAKHPSARIGGQTAAALRGLDGFDPGVPITLSTTRDHNLRTSEVRRRDRIGDTIDQDGLTICSIEETMVDLADGLRPRPGCRAASRPLPPIDLVELAIEAALRNELTTFGELVEAAASVRRHRAGAVVLAEALARRGNVIPTESYLETRLVQVLRDAGLPAFDRQVHLPGADAVVRRVDFHLNGVVVEVLGRKFHDEKSLADHRRFSRLGATGLIIVSAMFEDIEGPYRALIGTIRQAMASAAGRQPLTIADSR